MTQNSKRNFFKNWSWVLVPLIAKGGLLWPALGLLLIPIMVALIGIGLLRGKYWCGNICPHGNLFDRFIAPFSAGRKFPDLIKGPVLKWGFFLFFMGMFAFRVSGVLQHWGALDFWNRLGFVMVINYFIPTILGITMGLAIKPRAWCRFCPMGTVAELSYRLGRILKLNRKTDLSVAGSNPEKCAGCGLCNQACPLELYPQQAIKDKELQDPRCIKCSECTANCPRGILNLRRAV